MPVTTQTPINNYTGNASTLAFPFTFKILVNIDLKVYLNSVLLTTGYTVSGVGVDVGGSVTFTVAPAAGVVVRLQRIVTLNRNTDYVEGGQLASTTLDNDFDCLEMQIQDLDYQAFKEGSDGTLNATNRRLKNVANPVDAQDVATKNWAETAGSSFVLQSGTSATNAANSASATLANKNITDTNVTTSTTKATEASASAAAALANKNITDTNVTTTNNNVTTTNNNVTTTTTKATEASASAAAALASQNSAAASLDSFDDRYLGSKATAPTLDNDGVALIEGALYWNSVSKSFNAWNGSAWVSIVVNAQPLDAELTTLSGITSQQATALASLSPFVGTLLNDVDAATARATLNIAPPAFLNQFFPTF